VLYVTVVNSFKDGLYRVRCGSGQKLVSVL